MDPRMTELVHRAFDGECSAEERAELEAALARDPELRRFQTRLGELDEFLKAMPEDEVPTNLRSEILDAIREIEQPVLRHARRGPLSSRRRDIAYFVAGAAAMFLAGVGLMRLPLPGTDGAQSVGTLLPADGLQSQTIRVDGKELGVLRWADSADETVFELRWRADAPARVELEIDPEAPRLLRVRTEDQEASFPLAESANSGH